MAMGFILNCSGSGLTKFQNNLINKRMMLIKFQKLQPIICRNLLFLLWHYQTRNQMWFSFLGLTIIRFGVWEAAKWVARVRERTLYDPKRPILLNLTTDIVEENRYLQCKESALETAFLIKVMDS